MSTKFLKQTHVMFIYVITPDGSVYIYVKLSFFFVFRSANVAKLEGKIFSAVNNFFSSSPLVNQIKDLMVSTKKKKTISITIKKLFI